MGEFEFLVVLILGDGFRSMLILESRLSLGWFVFLSYNSDAFLILCFFRAIELGSNGVVALDMMELRPFSVPKIFSLLPYILELFSSGLLISIGVLW